MAISHLVEGEMKQNGKWSRLRAQCLFCLGLVFYAFVGFLWLFYAFPCFSLGFSMEAKLKPPTKKALGDLTCSSRRCSLQ